MDLERRAFSDLALRVEEIEGVRRIVGHAAVFNVLSEDLGGFRETIAPGAFRRAIAEDDVRALVNHDPTLILGRNRAGTLVLEEDATGLAVRIAPPETNLARDLLASMARGDISQMSFGFATREDSWETVDGLAVRTLRAVRLFDVSVVTFPAYPQTDAAVRSLAAWRDDASRQALASLRLARARERVATA